MGKGDTQRVAGLCLEAQKKHEREGPQAKLAMMYAGYCDSFSHQ